MAELGKKILIVDDDQMICKTLGKILDDSGYQTVHSENGEDAVKMLESQAFDLVITDIYMPGRNGLELASYIKSKHREMPVLAISSNFDTSQGPDALSLTSYFADDALAKPIQRNDLLISVRNLLSNSEVWTLYG